MSIDRFESRDLIRVPNLLSLSRIAFAALFPVALMRGGPIAALGVLALAGASDLLDGWWARRFHEETALGTAIDGVTDKIFVLTVVITLVATNTMSVVEALLLGTRDIGEMALAARLYFFTRGRAHDELFKKPHASNVPGKVATALQFMAVIAIILGTSVHAFWVGIAAVSGAIASVTYWIREADEGRRTSS